MNLMHYLAAEQGRCRACGTPISIGCGCDGERADALKDARLREIAAELEAAGYTVTAPVSPKLRAIPPVDLKAGDGASPGVAG